MPIFQNPKHRRHGWSLKLTKGHGKHKEGLSKVSFESVGVCRNIRDQQSGLPNIVHGIPDIAVFLFWTHASRGISPVPRETTASQPVCTTKTAKAPPRWLVEAATPLPCRREVAKVGLGHDPSFNHRLGESTPTAS